MAPMHAALRLGLMLGLGLGVWSGAPARAASPPSVFSVQGVLRDNAGQLQTLTASVTVRLYDAPAATTAFHTQVINAVEILNGVFTVDVQGFPTAPFTGGTLVWLGLQVGPDTELPRVSVMPSPYALVCGAADLAQDLGPAARASLQAPLAVVTPLVLDSDGRTLRLVNCQPGDTLVFQGSAWTCAPSAPTTDGGVTTVYQAGVGLTLNTTNNTFAVSPNGIVPALLADGAVEVRHLSALGCALDDQLLWDGVQWTCVPRAAAGTGLTLNAPTNTFGIANSGVDTAQLANGAVTFEKLGTAAVAPSGGNNGTAQTLARADHSHLADCPAGFVGRDAPGGLSRLCAKAVDNGNGSTDWHEAAQQCFENHNGSQLCTLNQLRIWCTGGNGLAANRWLGDRVSDDVGFQTNSNNCGNFDGQTGVGTNLNGMYCCHWFTRQ